MTKKKSIIGALLLITAFAVSAIAGGSSNAADFTITSGNLTAYIGTETTVYVPDNTTTISAGAFNNTAIDVIYLPTTITTVEDHAFANCSADVKIIFEMATPTSALPSGMENWGVANAGGQITTYTTSGITTYTLSDVSAIASTTKYAYIMDGRIRTLIYGTSMEGDNANIEKLVYTNTFANIQNDAVDVSKDGDNSVLMWGDGNTLYFCFDGDSLIMPVSMSEYCSGMTQLISIEGIEYWDTSEVENMGDLFWVCKSLESINLSNFNTSKVTNMGSMFQSCETLTSLDLSSFDTSNVDIMSAMFNQCSNLKNINVSSFDTSNVFEYSYMFGSCEELESIDITNFKIGKENHYDSNLRAMFYKCLKLKEVKMPVEKSTTTNNIYAMFYKCSELIEIDLSSMSIYIDGDIDPDGNHMENSFELCDKLQTVYVQSPSDADIISNSTNFPSGATVIVK